MAVPSPSPADRPPSMPEVRRLLGPAFAAWEALLDPALGRTTEWKRYGKNVPWALRVNEGKRTVLWTRPVKGELRVTVIVGEKKVAEALRGPLPRRLQKELRAAAVYPEGRAVRFRLRSKARTGDIERLVRLKLGRPEPAR